jgi:hypothetical protein
MVKRGGKDIVTVDVYRENYIALKAKATKERYDMKEYINHILKSYLDKGYLIEEMAPHLNIDSIQDNTITLKDNKTKNLVDVLYVGGELQCETDKATDCIHTRFVWASPELAKVAKSKKKLVKLVIA